MHYSIIIDINKPNGQYQLESNVNVIIDFIRNFPIRKVKREEKQECARVEEIYFR